MSWHKARGCPENREHTKERIQHIFCYGFAKKASVYLDEIRTGNAIVAVIKAENPANV